MKKLYSTLLFSILFSTILFSQATQLTVRGFSEGFYKPATGKMNAVLDPVGMPLVCDSGTVEVIDASSQTVMCFSPLVNTDGFAVVSVPSALHGQSFYVSMKFKNTYHVVSSQMHVMNGLPIMVDLTIPQNACCHFDSSNGKAKAYSGDLNLDGVIDVMDMTIWENDMHAHPHGYNIADVNGDQTIDTVDLAILETNTNLSLTDDRMTYCPTSIVGISELENQSFSIYPNPASSQIYLSKTEFNNESTDVSILDLTGREIKRIFWMGDSKELNIDISEIHAGIYAICIESHNGSRNIRKIVIE